MRISFLLITLILISTSGCITTENLSIGDTGTTKDDIEITVTEYKFVDCFERPRMIGEDYVNYPPKGATFLIMYLKVKNVGDLKTPSGTLSTGYYSDDAPKLLYAGTEMTPNEFLQQHGVMESYYDEIHYVSLSSTPEILFSGDTKYTPKFKGYGQEYPGITKEGWIAYVVPENIDLNKTELEIHGLKWSF